MSKIKSWESCRVNWHLIEFQLVRAFLQAALRCQEIRRQETAESVISSRCLTRVSPCKPSLDSFVALYALCHSLSHWRIRGLRVQRSYFSDISAHVWHLLTTEYHISVLYLQTTNSNLFHHCIQPVPKMLVPHLSWNSGIGFIHLKSWVDQSASKRNLNINLNHLKCSPTKIYQKHTKTQLADL